MYPLLQFFIDNRAPLLAIFWIFVVCFIAAIVTGILLFFRGK